MVDQERPVPKHAMDEIRGRTIQDDEVHTRRAGPELLRDLVREDGRHAVERPRRRVAEKNPEVDVARWTRRVPRAAPEKPGGENIRPVRPEKTPDRGFDVIPSHGVMIAESPQRPRGRTAPAVRVEVMAEPLRGRGGARAIFETMDHRTFENERVDSEPGVVS